jgi:hypothetical protein
MAAHDKKGKQKKQNVNPMRKELGESWVEAFISNNKLWGSEKLDKMILLEPRDYLDYAVVGVAEEADGTYRAVYDLNMLETVYACMYAYEEPAYRRTRFDDVVFALKDEHIEAAQEWVSYNTIRGSAHLGSESPLFIRAFEGGKVRLKGDFIG